MPVRSREYYVYIMTGRCGLFYTGVTNHLARRVGEHREGKCAFTARYGLNRLVYFESTPDIHDAIAFEKRVKNWRREKKIALIKLTNPRFLDLGETALGLDRLRPGSDVMLERRAVLGRSLHSAAAPVGMTESTPVSPVRP
jgi:putative endonuclease